MKRRDFLKTSAAAVAAAALPMGMAKAAPVGKRVFVKHIPSTMIAGAYFSRSCTLKDLKTRDVVVVVDVDDDGTAKTSQTMWVVSTLLKDDRGRPAVAVSTDEDLLTAEQKNDAKLVAEECVRLGRNIERYCDPGGHLWVG